MGAEANMRGRVCDALRVLHAVAIENSVDRGTPDVNCSAGWIELKQLPLWPVRAETMVRVPKFTQEQRLWLQNRCEKGGAAWLLLRVEDEWLLFWGAWAARHVGNCTREQLIEGAHVYWPNGLNGAELARALVKSTWSPH